MYLETLPAIRSRRPQFQLVPAETGRALFQAKGCAGCHRGKLSLENRASRSTIADISSAMWNHPPVNVESRPSLSYSEMSGLVSYLWLRENRGDEYRGRIVFAQKQCGACHRTAGAKPDGSRISLFGPREAVPMSIVTALGSHGPRLQAETSGKGVAWPRFRGSEMTDLVAYLESKAGTASAEAERRTAGRLGSLALHA